MAITDLSQSKKVFFNFYIRRRLTLSFFLKGLLFFTCNLHATGQTSVLMQHNNLKRTGWNNNETQLTQSNVSSGNFGEIFSRNVDDQIYAQPLIISNVSVGGGIHNIVIVATVNNSVYAFDADDANTVSPYWQKNLTFSPGSYRPIKTKDMTGACGGYYVDFSDKMGIIGTPVIDNLSNTLYVVVRSVNNAGTDFVQYLHALDITTGNERPNSPVHITATINGTGDGNVGGVISFDSQKQNQRPGLLLYNGVVYIAWASHCDWGPYHGWILGYDAGTLGQKYVYNDTKNGGLGGIWMSGQAPAVDDNGFIYVSTGNGTTGSPGNANDTTNRSESVLKLSTSSGTLQVADFFTPNNYNYLTNNDLDYGVDGVMLIPNTNMSLSGSKESYLYLIDNTKMGGATVDNSNVRQLLNVNASSTQAEKHIHGSPVYYQDNTGDEYVYVWAENGLLKQFPFKRSSLLFDTLNKILGNTVLPPGMPGAMLAVSSNGNQAGTGILWASHPINGDANHSVVPGILQAYDATDVTRELWNSNMSGARDSIGKFAKFVNPTIANGKVYMATFSNNLKVYGLNPPPASACPTPLSSPWLSADIGFVAYPGDVCDNGGVYTLNASGDDIGNSADAFHYLYQSAAGSDISIIARVVSVQNTSTLAKAGVMFRSNLDNGSANIFMAITSGSGAVFQNRLSQNNTSSSTSKSGLGSPYWIKLLRSGNKYVGYVSPDGTTWTAVDSITMALGANSYVGIAYTAHNNNQSATAIVDHVSVNLAALPLPVDLVRFTASNINNSYAELKWITTNEVNNDHFDIERSGANSDFKFIGMVKSQGNVNVMQQYNFIDPSPLDGLNFYRLKQVDINGIYSYSAVAKANFSLALVDIYPNPARTQIFVKNNNNFSNGDNLVVQLSDAFGQLIYNRSFTGSGGAVITVNIPQEATNGMYVLKVMNSKKQVQARKIYVNR